MPNINLQRADPNAAAQTAVRPSVSGGPSHKLAILEGMSRALGAQGEARQRLAQSIMGFGRAIAENGQKIAGIKDDAAKKIIEAETRADLTRFGLLLKKDYQDALQETRSQKYRSAEDQCNAFAENFKGKAEARISNFLSYDQIQLAKGECFRYAQQLHITQDDPVLRALVDNHIASGSEFFTTQWYKEQLALDQFTLNYQLMDLQSSLVDSLLEAKTDADRRKLIEEADTNMYNACASFPQLAQNTESYKNTATQHIDQALLTWGSQVEGEWLSDSYIVGRLASGQAQAEENQKNRELRAAARQKQNEQRNLNNQRARRDKAQAQDRKDNQKANQERKKEKQAEMAAQNSAAVKEGIGK